MGIEYKQRTNGRYVIWTMDEGRTRLWYQMADDDTLAQVLEVFGRELGE